MGPVIFRRWSADFTIRLVYRQVKHWGRTSSGTAEKRNGTVVYGQSCELLRVRTGRSDTGVDEHLESRYGAQALNLAGGGPCDIREVLVRPRPQPRLVLRA